MRAVTRNVGSISFGIVNIPRISSVGSAPLVWPGFTKNNQGYPVRNWPSPGVVVIQDSAASGYPNALANSRRRRVIVEFNCSLAPVAPAGFSSMTADHCAVFECIEPRDVSAAILTIYYTSSLDRAQIVDGIVLDKEKLLTAKIGRGRP